MKIIVAKAHEEQLKDNETKREYDSVCEAMNAVSLDYKGGTVNFVFIKGLYNHFEKKMTTACVFVNKTDKSIIGLHGKLRLRFNTLQAQIATTTIDFDPDFFGQLNPDEGMLVHINIPVKGLTEDMELRISDITGDFSEVSVACV